MVSRLHLAIFLATVAWISPSFAQLNPTLQNIQDGLHNLFPNFTLPNFTLPTLPTLTPFPPVPCTGPTTIREGFCRTDAQCRQVGGVPDGPCALNLGVCCTNTFRCGSTALFNNSYFSSDAYPNSTTQSSQCRLTINKLPQLSQIRLELIVFEIEGPDAQGRCNDSAMIIEGANPNFSAPRLCGNNSGQHIIIPVDRATGQTVIIRFQLAGGPAKWLIKVVQLDRNSPNLAPAGCLQYHSGLSGNFSSFNYDAENRTGSGNIDGLVYSICFRRELAFCSIRLEPVLLRLRRDTPYVYPMHAPMPLTRYISPLSHLYSSFARPKEQQLRHGPVYQYPLRHLQPQSLRVPYRPSYSSPFEHGWEVLHPNGSAVVNMPDAEISIPTTPSPVNASDSDGQVAPIVDLEPTPTPTDEETSTLPIEQVTPSLQICAGQDTIIIPPQVLCASVGIRAVTLDVQPFNVYVLNQGQTHNQGFQFNWRQLSC